MLADLCESVLQGKLCSRAGAGGKEVLLQAVFEVVIHGIVEIGVEMVHDLIPGGKAEVAVNKLNGFQQAVTQGVLGNLISGVGNDYTFECGGGFVAEFTFDEVGCICERAGQVRRVLGILCISLGTLLDFACFVRINGL